MSELLNVTMSLNNTIQTGSSCHHQPDPINVTELEELLRPHSNLSLEHLLFMKSPLPVLSIISCYLLFVLKLGPAMMKNREPFRLYYVLVFYNLYQIIFSAWLLTGAFRVAAFRNFVFKFQCIPDTPDPALDKIIVYDGWWFFICKLVELLDTVFFTLRKKYNQVTFLHVFHHSHMAFITWFILKYFPGFQLIQIAVFVTAEHLIMYTYYFLCALGPKYAGMFRMKKLTTRLQILQFVALITYFTFNIVRGCKVSTKLTCFLIANLAFYLFLYLKFYQSLYGKHVIEDCFEEEDGNNNKKGEKIIDKKTD